MINKVNMAGLKQILYYLVDNDFKTTSAIGGNRWCIAKGAYDLRWQLLYEGAPVIDCIQATDESCATLENDCLEAQEFIRLASFIKRNLEDENYGKYEIGN